MRDLLCLVAAAVAFGITLADLLARLRREPDQTAQYRDFLRGGWR